MWSTMTSSVPEDRHVACQHRQLQYRRKEGPAKQYFHGLVVSVCLIVFPRAVLSLSVLCSYLQSPGHAQSQN